LWRARCGDDSHGGFGRRLGETGWSKGQHRAPGRPYSKRYTAEFKRDAVALVRSSPHRNVTEIARELGVSPEGLRGWVKQAKIDQGEGPAGALTSEEREELRRLRRELTEVKKANEILVKAAPGSASIPSSGTSPRSKPEPGCSTTSPPQRKHPLSKIRGELHGSLTGYHMA